MQTLFKRTNLSVSLEDALNDISRLFKLGAISQFSLLNTGYQDLNIKLITEKGIFIVKFFSKDRAHKRISDIVKVMLSCHQKNISVQNILTTEDGQILTLSGPNGNTYITIFKYFPGNDFYHTTATYDDYKHLAKTIAQINSLDIEIDRFYDDWGPANFFPELENTISLSDKNILSFVKEIKTNYESLDTTNFQKSIIHGDLHRSNVLKSSVTESNALEANGFKPDSKQYCIIDFGCTDFNWCIFDLAIFFAWFCFDEAAQDSMQEIYSLVLNEYTRYKTLSKEEIGAIPILVSASYATYYLATARLLSQEDSTEQTKIWHEKSYAGLNKSAQIKKLRFC